MKLWTYWDGPRNPFIDTCLASMERVCTDGTTFHLVTPENVNDYVGDSLHPNWRKIVGTHGCNPIAMQAGAIRAALLARHGGMYWDADTIGLRNPKELVKQYENMRYANANRASSPTTADVLYTTWDRPPLRALNGYIYMRQGCPDALEWLARVNKRLETQVENPVVWTELGEITLTPILVHSSTAWRVPREVFLLIDVDSNVEHFFTSFSGWTHDPEKANYADRAVCIGLNQSWFWCHRHKDMDLPPEQWGDSPLVIHRLLAWARNQ
tara:strand:- start:1167 stop:1970 length:804 start_codon:yes stop_codon:yes gene_type:complete